MKTIPVGRPIVSSNMARQNVFPVLTTDRENTSLALKTLLSLQTLSETIHFQKKRF